MGDAVRLAVGTLTVLRVPPPRVVDRAVGARAMALAPLVGLLLGVLGAAAGLAVDLLGPSAFVVAVVVVGVLALLTRGLHLDGLADTADGLGSGRRGTDALAVMSRSDIGPFGVITLVLVLFAQVAALAQLWNADRVLGAVAVVVAAVASRAALPVLCRRSVPAAKATGLGSVVASAVGRGLLGAALTVTLVVVMLVGAIGAALVDDSVLARDVSSGPALAGYAVVATVLALAVVAVLARRCVSRFGGVTGDVLGAGVELTFTLTLLTLTTQVA